jgi:hypothetical protein
MSPRSRTGDPAVTKPEGCTVCDHDCTALFSCSLCGMLRSVCWYRVGGFEATKDICSVCLAGIHSEEMERLRRARMVMSATKGIS